MPLVAYPLSPSYPNCTPSAIAIQKSPLSQGYTCSVVRHAHDTFCNRTAFAHSY